MKIAKPYKWEDCKLAMVKYESRNGTTLLRIMLTVKREKYIYARAISPQDLPVVFDRLRWKAVNNGLQGLGFVPGGGRDWLKNFHKREGRNA